MQRDDAPRLERERCTYAVRTNSAASSLSFGKHKNAAEARGHPRRPLGGYAQGGCTRNAVNAPARPDLLREIKQASPVIHRVSRLERDQRWLIAVCEKVAIRLRKRTSQSARQPLSNAGLLHGPKRR